MTGSGEGPGAGDAAAGRDVAGSAPAATRPLEDGIVRRFGGPNAPAGRRNLSYGA